MDNYLTTLGMTMGFRILLIAGAIAFALIILFLLKRGKLNVQYSIIWIGLAAVFLLFAAWPELVLHIKNIVGLETAPNMIFLILFAFVLLLLLSISTIITGFARRIKRLTQTQALLEKRVRELEAQLAQAQSEPTTKGE